MASLLEQLNEARADVSRLQGIETSLREQFALIPNGDVSALLTEHGRRNDEILRLTGELSGMTARATNAEGDVLRLTGELDAARNGASQDQVVKDLAESRAAEIVANAGVPPAAAETAKAVTASAKPANSESFYAEYSRLHAESPAKAAAYWQQWDGKF